jgi:hypothetical protein
MTHRLNQFRSTREVSTVAYDKQKTHLRSIVVVDHGVWPMDFSEKKIDRKI